MILCLKFSTNIATEQPEVVQQPHKCQRISHNSLLGSPTLSLELLSLTKSKLASIWQLILKANLSKGSTSSEAKERLPQMAADQHQTNVCPCPSFKSTILSCDSWSHTEQNFLSTPYMNLSWYSPRSWCWWSRCYQQCIMVSRRPSYSSKWQY